MHPRARPSRTALAFLSATLGGLACTPVRPAIPATEPTQPWDDLDPVALDPFRQLLRTSLPAAQTPSRMRSLPDVPMTFVLDPSAGKLWALDPRYRHEPQRVCTDPSLWADLDPEGERQGHCKSGKVEANRGALDPGSPVLAFAVDRRDPGVWLLGQDGALAWANLDPLEGNPLDFSRPEHRGGLSLADGAIGLAAAASGGLWLADQARIRLLDSAGAVQAEAELDEPVLDLAASSRQAWILGERGLWTWDGRALALHASVDGQGGRLAAWEDRICAALPAEGRVLCSDGSSVAVDGLQGPISQNAASTWLATDQGVQELRDGELQPPRAVEALVDLQVQDNGELALLYADNTVGVYVDETLLPGAAPLKLTLLSFLENPKRSVELEECLDQRSIIELFEQAENNTRLLEDLPASVGLGITAEVAHQARLCELDAQLAALWDRPRVSTGLLLSGEEDADLVDLEAMTALVREQAAQLDALDLPLRWLGAAPRLGDGGADWVEALHQVDITEDLLFFGFDLLPEIDRWDPRTKDPIPWRSNVPLSAWRPSSGPDPLVDDPDRQLWLRPGSTLSLYSLGGCANVFLYECKQSNLGGNTAIDEGDLEVLDLLLWRALAVRSIDGPDHWSFHLPDISVSTYTEGCRRTDRLWTAEEEGGSCQAEGLQTWVFDVQARYEQAGLLSWWLPGEG